MPSRSACVNVVVVKTEPVQRPPLDAARLAALHPDVVPGVRVEVLDTSASTNAEVAQRARDGAPDGLVVVTEHQTAGRGRLDRTWETPARSAITFSMLLRPTVPAAQWPWLPLLTGYAVNKALTSLGYDAGVKWPNDVLIGGAKVAGILVERIETPGGPAAVVGVGINAGMGTEELPVATATSLALAGGGEPDRTEVLVAVLAGLREAYDSWQAGGEQGPSRLSVSYARACLTVGRDVRVDLPSGEVLTGRATGIDETGRLVVEGPGGPTAVGAGDVIHVRTTS